jgi:hypothetical protein
MYTSETGGFRLHQALADLNRQRLSFPLAPIRRIGAGLGVRASGVPDLQRRLEWYFSGKVPAAELRRDGLVHGALLMASALPEDDYDSFIAANVLLLVERLSAHAGRDDGFWNWKRLAPHFRLAAPDLRAAIMCGFREARRAGRVSLSEGPGAEDCLTVPRNEILGFLGRNRVEFPLLSLVERAVREETDAQHAGDLWVTQHSNAARLPDGQRQMALAGFRYLYERPLSMEPPASADAPVIPGLD